MKPRERKAGGLRVLLCLLMAFSLVMGGLGPIFAQKAGLEADGSELPDNVVATGALSEVPEPIERESGKSSSGEAIALPEPMRPMNAPLRAPVISGEGDEFYYTEENADGSAEYSLLCVKLSDGGLKVSVDQAADGADVVIPDEINGMEVVTLAAGPAEAADAIGTLTVPDELRTVYGNLYGWNKTKSAKLASDLGIDTSYDGTFSVPDTPAALAAIPSFISDHYDDDGAYYAGKCLVRVDPSHEGDLIVNDGTVCVLAGAFEGCSKIGAVILPDSLEYIGVRAFANSSVSSVNLPKGMDVRSAQAREANQNMGSGNGPVVIETLTFFGCDELETVTVEADQIYDVGFMAFLGCSAISEFDMTKVGFVQSLSFAGAFAEGYALDLSATQEQYIGRTSPNSEGKYPYGRSYGWGPFLDSGISSVTFGENSFQYITFECFRSCDNLSEISFTEGQVSAGTRAFENCASLTDDIFAEGCYLRNMKWHAFAGCGFTEITVPETVLYLDGGVFAGNPQLDTVNWKSVRYFEPASEKSDWVYSGDNDEPQPYELVNGGYTTGQFFAVLDDSMNGAGPTGSYDGQQSAYDSLTESDSYTQIHTLNIYAVPDSGAGSAGAQSPSFGIFFCMQPFLEEVNVLCGMESIPAMAFQMCGNLKSFTLSEPDSLKSVGDNAFGACGFEEMTVMKDVSYGKNAFMCNRKLKKLVIEEGVTETSPNMFERCTSLSEVSVPESLKTVGWASFKAAGSGASFYVPAGAETVEDDAFGYAESSAQRFEIILMGDPAIELFHPGGPSGSKSTYAFDNFSVYRIWTAGGSNFTAYRNGANYLPSDIRPLPGPTAEVRCTEKKITLGDEPDKSKVSVTVNGELLSADDFELDFDVNDRTVGERFVRVILNGTPAESYLSSRLISAAGFRGEETEGPVYSVIPGSELGFTVEVAEAEYEFTEGDGSVWTKHQGSGDLSFTVKRAESDELSFERFTGLQIDGKELAEDQYTAQAGSVEIALSAEWLENAFVGVHSIAAMFKDGHAEATFTVEAVPPDTLPHAEDNDGTESGVTYDSAAAGIRLNLFDYHIDSDWWQYGDRWANQGGQWSFGGINDVSNLKFYGHGGPEVMHGNSNEYTGRATARQGIVQRKLQPDPDAADASKAAKYPVMTEFGQQNLAVLFKPESVEGQKTVYRNVNHLFQKDAQGNYWYDSDVNYAYYDPAQGDGGNFVLYDGTFQVNMTNPENQPTEEKFNVGYYPFDDWDESKQNIAPTDDLKDQGIEGYDHQHGLTMDCNFYIPASGTVDGEDLIFRFSGDDDVWVFVDDVLVLDMGGIHKPVSGEINFTTGEVSVEDVVVLQPWDGQDPPVETPDTIGSYSTLDEIFEGEWSGSGTAKPRLLKAPKLEADAPNPGQGWHQLRFFYLERGGCYSNMSLMTNLWKATGDRQYTQFRVRKEWADEEDHSADSVTVRLLADGEPYEDAKGEEVTVELSEKNGWSHQFTRLPRYADEDADTLTPVIYSVEELPVEGHYASYTSGGKLVASRTVWVETDPSELEDGEIYTIISNNWTDGDRDIMYRVDGDTIGYQNVSLKSQAVTDTDGRSWDTVLMNPVSAAAKFTFQKVEEQGEASEEGGEARGRWIISTGGRNLTLRGHNNWSWWGETHDYAFVLTDQTGWNGQENNNYLPELFVTPDGGGTATISGIEYWMPYGQLQADPEQYMLLNQDSSIGATDNPGWAGHYRFFKAVTEEKTVSVAEDLGVVNIPAGDLSVEKKVEGPKTADHEFTFTVTLSGSVERSFGEDGESVEIAASDINGKYGDAEFKDGVATIKLKDGEKAEIKGIPAGLSYSVSESPRTGYEQSSEGSSGTFSAEKAAAVFTNEVKTVDIPVKKIWSDADDQDGKRPDSVSVKLLANGKESAGAELSEAGGWTFTFEGLPEYDADGQRIVYSVEENRVDDYGEPAVKTEYEDDGVTVALISVKNSREPSRIDVEVTKVWNDAEDQDGKRPDSVTVKLLADGKDTGLSAELSEDNGWSFVFEGLDEFRDRGKAIVYSVAELDVDGYSSEVKPGDSAGSLVVTNTHEVRKTSVAVTKVWKDADDQDGIRPKEISVSLLADGKDSGRTLKLSEENGWTGSFEELDAFANGREIAYSVAETETRGYASELSGDAASGFTLTNTHEPALTEIEVEKLWNDENDREGLRPASVTVRLLADGEETGDALELSESCSWKGSFSGLPVKKGGKLISYSVSEDVPEKYSAKVSGDAKSGFKITNSRGVTPPTPPTPPTPTPGTDTGISVRKLWSDADDKDGIRPDHVTVRLLVNGEDSGKSVRLSESNGWRGRFEGLDAYVGGKKAEYSVEELVPDGYEASVSGSRASGFVITNTHEPQTPPEPPKPEEPPRPEDPSEPELPPEPPLNPEVPKTGEESGRDIWASMMALSALASALLAAAWVRRRRS